MLHISLLISNILVYAILGRQASDNHFKFVGIRNSFLDEVRRREMFFCFILLVNEVEEVVSLQIPTVLSTENSTMTARLTIPALKWCFTSKHRCTTTWIWRHLGSDTRINVKTLRFEQPTHYITIHGNTMTCKTATRLQRCKSQILSTIAVLRQPQCLAYVTKYYNWYCEAISKMSILGLSEVWGTKKIKVKDLYAIKADPLGTISHISHRPQTMTSFSPASHGEETTYNYEPLVRMSRGHIQLQTSCAYVLRPHTTTNLLCVCPEATYNYKPLVRMSWDHIQLQTSCAYVLRPDTTTNLLCVCPETTYNYEPLVRMSWDHIQLRTSCAYVLRPDTTTNLLCVCPEATYNYKPLVRMSWDHIQLRTSCAYVLRPHTTTNLLCVCPETTYNYKPLVRMSWDHIQLQTSCAYVLRPHTTTNLLCVCPETTYNYKPLVRMSWDHIQLQTSCAYVLIGFSDSKNSMRAASPNAIFSYAFSMHAAISSLKHTFTALD